MTQTLTYSYTSGELKMSVIDDVLKTKTVEELVFEKASKKYAVPELTTRVVEDTITLLKQVEKNGGYGDIASSIGHDKITKAQVKEIHSKMIFKIGELLTAKAKAEAKVEAV